MVLEVGLHVLLVLSLKQPAPKPDRFLVLARPVEIHIFNNRRRRHGETRLRVANFMNVTGWTTGDTFVAPV